MNTDRRGFLGALAALAVVSQLPAAPVAEVVTEEVLVRDLLTGIRDGGTQLARIDCVRRTFIIEHP